MISSPYLNSVGSGTVTRNGTGNSSVGTIDFIQERDYFADVRGTLFHRLDYVAGIMNNNNFQANSVGANGPKVFYSRARFLVTDISFISFTVLAGESNNDRYRKSTAVGKEPLTGTESISAIRLATFLD